MVCLFVSLLFLIIVFLFNRFLLALKDKPENNPVEDEVAQEQNVSEITSELQDKNEPCTCLVPLAEGRSETKPAAVIPGQQPPPKPKLAARPVLSPLTLFLLGTDAKHTDDPLYVEWMQEKRKRWYKYRGKKLN